MPNPLKNDCIIRVKSLIRIQTFNRTDVIHNTINSYYPSRGDNIVKATLPLFKSIESTQTVTISPTETTSRGCFTNCCLVSKYEQAHLVLLQYQQKHQNQQHFGQYLVTPFLLLNPLI